MKNGIPLYWFLALNFTSNLQISKDAVSNDG